MVHLRGLLYGGAGRVWRVLAVWVLASGLAGGAVAPVQPAPSVLLLSSFGEDLTGLTTALSDAIQAEAGRPVEVAEEYTGLDRYAGAAYEASLLRMYQTKYAGRRMDLIVVVGPSALSFLLDSGMMPGVPVVTCFVPQRLVEEARKRRPELTGAVHPANAPMTVDLMLALYPRTRRIHIILGASEYERTQAEFGRQIFKRFAGRIEFDYMNDLTLDQMVGRVRGLAEEDLVLFGSLQMDAGGRSYPRSFDPVRALAEASSRPMFVLDTQMLGTGALGGILISNEETAKASAAVGLAVMAGQPASAVPLRLNSGAVPMFDWRQVRRWGVRESALPRGAEIRFRQPSLWGLYWKEIGTGLVLITVESLLVAALVLQLRRRKRTERRLAEAEVRYRTVADFTHDWEFWQRPDGSFHYLSPSCAQVSGYPPEAFLEQPGLFREIVQLPDLPLWDRHQAAVLAGAPAPAVEFRIRTRSEVVRWVELANNPVRVEGLGFLGTRGSVRDITGRKEGELALQTAYGEIQVLKDRLEAENTYYREQVQAEESANNLLGNSDPMKYLQFRIRQVAPSETSVLIQGETGTGKELVAEAIHAMGPRAERPLIKVNCATLPQSLAESELFGHEKGAFTGAQSMRKGRFELADGATLFLDEIGELSGEVQAKMLRVLQSGEFQRVGGDRTLKVDVRVIAATNRDLAREVAAGRFREDLWYRLNVFPITVPPLRNRKDDIPSLTQAFAAQFCLKAGRPPLDLPNALLQALAAYAWPGNVRELQNVLERAVLVSTGSVLQLAEPLLAGGTGPLLRTEPPRSLEAMEREHILRMLESTGWKVEGAQGAAALLDLKPSTLRNRMLKLEIKRSAGF